MITASYKVNKDLYYANTHTPNLTTTEYTYRNNKLVHLCIGKNLGIRLNNILQYEIGKSLTNEQFFYGKTYSHAKPKPTTRSTYEQKLMQFDMKQTVVEREIVEEYAYTDKTGRRDTVQIAVTIKTDGITATIDFRDTEQYEKFTCPEWITLI